MDIQEIKNRKSHLEKQILCLIAEFEVETSCSLDYISINKQEFNLHKSIITNIELIVNV